MKPRKLPQLLLTQSQLRYNPSTGKISGKNTVRNKNGYIYICVDGQNYLAHRIAWFLFHKVDCYPFQVDHIDQDRSNNKIKNLRLVDGFKNARNRGKDVRNTSGFSGVTYEKSCSKWRAQIFVNGKNKHLGLFEKIEDAVNARKIANTRHEYHINHGKEKKRDTLA